VPTPPPTIFRHFRHWGNHGGIAPTKNETALPTDGEAEEWKKRGNEQYDLGNFKRAIASFDKALEFKPDYHLASKNRTRALKKLGIV
jgi:tetratricopeptide (TPR) repeat protein